MKNIKVLKLFLGGAFLALIAYNCSIALKLKSEPIADAWEYIHLGLSISKNGEYGYFNASRDQILQDFKDNNIQHQKYEIAKTTAFRPPVWPILIAGIFFFFGYNLTYLIFFKVILHCLGIFIFWKTLKLFKLNEVIIIFGTFLYGISPAWQIYSRVFLSEPITFFFITLWVYLLIRCIKRKTGYIPQAIVAGILILSHPYYLFLPFSVWFILFIKKEINLKKFLVSVAMATFLVLIWIIRNGVVMDTQDIVLTTSSGAVMAKGWNNKVPTDHTNTQGDLADEELVLLNFKTPKNLGSGEIQKMKLYKEATLHFIKTNPNLVLPIIATKLKSAFNPFPENPKPGILQTGRWLFQFLSLLALLYVIFASRNALLKAFAIGLVLSTIGITIVTYSGFRFRMPQVGLELLLLVFTVNEIKKKLLVSEYLKKLLKSTISR